mmetsp:Transcript_29237/g.30355  ORF Transcript_29237/g.30355 Transcript_29237/m.30355 type:complete len:122 (+) Transcript_29237:90-455(+)
MEKEENNKTKLQPQSKTRKKSQSQTWEKIPLPVRPTVKKPNLHFSELFTQDTGRNTLNPFIESLNKDLIDEIDSEHKVDKTETESKKKFIESNISDVKVEDLLNNSSDLTSELNILNKLNK